MKKTIISVIFLFVSFFVLADTYVITSNDTRAINVGCSGGARPHLSEPVVMYNMTLSTITVDFGTQPVNSFVVTISSLYTDVDYYATSSFTTIPLAPDGFSDYSIVITTAAGDVFEGTLTASDYTDTIMY